MKGQLTLAGTVLVILSPLLAAALLLLFMALGLAERLGQGEEADW